MGCIILLAIFLIRSCNALVGYDCKVPHDNGTIVSLLEPASCHSLEETLVDVSIELVQIPRTATIDVLSCRIEIENVVYVQVT